MNADRAELLLSGLSPLERVAIADFGRFLDADDEREIVNSVLGGREHAERLVVDYLADASRTGATDDRLRAALVPRGKVLGKASEHGLVDYAFRLDEFCPRLFRQPRATSPERWRPTGIFVPAL